MGVATSRVSGLAQCHGLPRSLLRALQGVRHEVASQVQPGACQGVRGLDRGGIGAKLEMEVKDQVDFGTVLKDGAVLCQLINAISPGSVKKINTMKAPFKQRENIEMYLKACAAYGLKEQDLFQVNDLYENKNLYMVVDNLYNLGGMTQKNGWDGPVLGVKQATENKRQFDEEVLKAGHSMIGLQYGTNKGASQAGMTPYGASRQIRPEDFIKNGEPDRTYGRPGQNSSYWCQFTQGSLLFPSTIKNKDP